MKVNGTVIKEIKSEIVRAYLMVFVMNLITVLQGALSIGEKRRKVSLIKSDFQNLLMEKTASHGLVSKEGITK